MYKKLAKLKYLANNYEVIENGDYVVCAISGKSGILKKHKYTKNSNGSHFLNINISSTYCLLTRGLQY